MAKKVGAGRLPIPPSPYWYQPQHIDCVSAGVKTTTNHSQDQNNVAVAVLLCYEFSQRWVWVCSKFFCFFPEAGFFP
jgi:hypothetical protein